jgi:hypothetical protein
MKCKIFLIRFKITLLCFLSVQQLIESKNLVIEFYVLNTKNLSLMILIQTI